MYLSEQARAADVQPIDPKMLGQCIVKDRKSKSVCGKLILPRGRVPHLVGIHKFSQADANLLKDTMFKKTSLVKNFRAVPNDTANANSPSKSNSNRLVPQMRLANTNKEEVKGHTPLYSNTIKDAIIITSTESDESTHWMNRTLARTLNDQTE